MAPVGRHAVASDPRCRVVDGGARVRRARRRGRELAAVAFALDPALARALGTLELVERCRDEHLASLEADDGLLVLGISWEEVVRRADGYRIRALS